MKIVTVTVRKIYNDNGIVIFEFPAKTLLDKIILDLWNEIIKYINCHEFILWNFSVPCPGYRKVRKNEFETLKKSFINYYNKNEGIPNILNTNCPIATQFIIDENYTDTIHTFFTTLCKYSDDKTKIVLYNWMKLEIEDISINAQKINLDRNENRLVLMIAE
jgi:hypothetical protein